MASTFSSSSLFSWTSTRNPRQPDQLVIVVKVSSGLCAQEVGAGSGVVIQSSDGEATAKVDHLGARHPASAPFIVSHRKWS